MTPPARWALVAVLALLGPGLGTACGDDTVRLAYRPAPGDRSAYRIVVRAVSVTTVGDEPPRRTEADTVLQARHRVLDSGRGGWRVEVRLREDGGAERTLVVRLDRAGDLTEVERIEGLPAGALGDLGLAEIFPAAATAPPDRPIEPGDRWSIDEPVRLGGPAPAHLRGQGRLSALEVARGRELARVESTYRLPVRRTAEQTGGRLRLEGTQRTRATTVYDLEDGSVHAVRARTRGRYDLTLLPPTGLAGVPVAGTLVVDVNSTTSRLR